MEAGTFKTPYDFFVHQVRQNLRVVLAMDPTHPKFLLRCESNPALYTRCTLLWLGTWSRASMRMLPGLLPGVSDLLEGRFNDDDEDDEGTTHESKSEGKEEAKGESKYDADDDYLRRRSSYSSEELLDLLMEMQDSVENATPLEFVGFLETWQHLHGDKRSGISREIKKLRSGLAKLDSASRTVDELSRDATKSAKELAEAQVKADAAMEQITKTLSDASSRRTEVADLQEQVGEKERHTLERQEQIKSELADIQPILDQAKKAVGGIKSEHLNEITALKMPPEPIADVLGAVLKLLGVRDVSWLSMKKFLRSRGVKDDIVNFDATKITPAIRNDVAKVLKTKAQSFDHATIFRASAAAAPLAAWVKANIKYSLVLEKIQPLTDELSVAERELEHCQQRLESCEAEIREIDDKVSKLKDEFAARTREAESLRAGLERVKSTLDKAQALLGQLSGEQERWSSEARRLAGQLVSLPKLMLLASGFMTYLAKRPEEDRARYISRWTKAAHLGDADQFSFAKLLSTESQLLVWKSEGLPSDSLSQENALVIAHSRSRVPFVIDPADAASRWLDFFFGSDPIRPLEKVPAFDPRFVSQVELAVRFGKTLLLVDVDGLDPMLYPLARRDLYKDGSRLCVHVGEKVMDWNENFRMCVVTRNPEVELPPDAAALVVEVNFSVTRSGLEGQLLGITIQHEQPELEKEKQEMLQQEESFKVQLADLESTLLHALAEAEGDILENHTLIESLTKTKATAAQIQDSLKASAAASVQLDAQRDSYRPFARDGSNLFFLVRQLVAVNPMYRFSLGSFIQLFTQTLDKEMTSTDLQQRLALLTPELETRVLFSVGRGLFKSDRPMWALHVVHGMRPDAFDDNEWEYFTGQLIVDKSKARSARSPDWIDASCISAFEDLAAAFPKLVQSLDLDNVNKWSRFSRAQDCEAHFPAKTTGFQRLMVIKALRPDRLFSAMQFFASEMLRVPSLAPPPLSFSEIHSTLATAAQQPVLLITTPGSDPSKELEEFALGAVGRDRYQDLAMGGGQQEAALEMLRDAASRGDWLCLKNLHLVVAWLPTLEKAIASMEGKMNPSFRLWLTTEPHRDFPPILLQNSLKITFESPPGIKKNIQRTLTSWGKDFLERRDSSSDRTRGPLLFLLAWFHAVVQERRTYIPQGWSKGYEFSVGDLRAGAIVLDKVSRSDDLDFKLIHGLMEDAIYGGRVDNLSDLRVLRTYISDLFDPSLLARGGQIAKGISMPKAFSMEDLAAFVARLPDSDQPSVFGLPDNIERAVQRSMSTNVLDLLRSLAISEDSAMKFDRERWRSLLSPLIDLWESLFVQKEDRRSSASAGNGRPVDEFVALEFGHSVTLCRLVDKDMCDLKRVIFGTELLTPATQSVAQALLGGQVPSKWEKRWEGPSKVTNWLESLVSKFKALNKWLDRVESGRLLDDAVDLSDLFNPGTFLNALRQQTARHLGVSMDRTKLVSSLNKTALSGNDTVAVIEGLQLEGAELERGRLVAMTPASPDSCTCPPVYITFCSTTHPGPFGGVSTLPVPTYLSSSRESHLVDLEIPIEGDSSQWVLAGVAFFLGKE